MAKEKEERLQEQEQERQQRHATQHQTRPHRDMQQQARMDEEQEAYLYGEKSGNSSPLMRNGELDPQMIMKIYRVEPEQAERLCNTMQSIQEELDINKDDIAKLAEYILDKTAEEGYVSYDGYYEIIGDRGQDIKYEPFACVCADMLRCDATKESTICGIDAREFTGIVGLLSQGKPWEQVTYLTEGHDGLDIMAMENRSYKDPDISFEELKNTHATLSFEQYARYEHNKELYDEPALMTEKTKKMFEEYKQWEHVSERGIKTVEMQQASHQRQLAPTEQDIADCKAMADKYHVSLDLALCLGPKDMVPDVFNATQQEQWTEHPAEFNIYQMYKDVVKAAVQKDLSNEYRPSCMHWGAYTTLGRNLYTAVCAVDDKTILNDLRKETFEQRDELSNGIARFEGKDEAVVAYDQHSDQVGVRLPSGNMVIDSYEAFSDILQNAQLNEEQGTITMQIGDESIEMDSHLSDALPAIHENSVAVLKEQQELGYTQDPQEMGYDQDQPEIAPEIDEHGYDKGMEENMQQEPPMVDNQTFDDDFDEH